MKHFNIISLTMLIIFAQTMFGISTLLGIKQNIDDDESTSLLQGHGVSYQTNDDFMDTMQRGSQQDIDDYLSDDKWVLSTPIETFIQAENIAAKRKKQQVVNKLRQIIQAKAVIHYYQKR